MTDGLPVRCETSPVNAPGPCTVIVFGAFPDTSRISIAPLTTTVELEVAITGFDQRLAVAVAFERGARAVLELGIWAASGSGTQRSTSHGRPWIDLTRTRTALVPAAARRKSRGARGAPAVARGSRRTGRWTAGMAAPSAAPPHDRMELTEIVRNPRRRG